MFENVKIVFCSTLLFVLTLGGWKFFFAFFDLAVLFLLGLASVLVFAVYSNLAILYKARNNMMLTANSPLHTWLSPVRRSFVVALFFSLVFITQLAYHALTINLILTFGFVLVFALCSITFLFTYKFLHTQNWVKKHLCLVFAKTFASSAPLLIAIPLMIFLSWQFSSETIQPPQRNSPIVQFFGFFYFIDNIKQWLLTIINFWCSWSAWLKSIITWSPQPECFWGKVIHGIDNSLMAIIVAQVSVSLTSLFKNYFQPQPPVASEPAPPEQPPRH